MPAISKRRGRRSRRWARNIIHVGAVGAGEVAKLCNNLISGSALIAVAEAFRIGEAFGVDPQILTNVIAKSSGATWVMEHMHPVPGIVDSAASSRQYAPGFMTDLMAKDLGLAVSAAREKRVPVVVAPAAQQLYRMASSHGLGREDFSVGLQIPEAVERRRPGVARGGLPTRPGCFRCYLQEILQPTASPLPELCAGVTGSSPGNAIMAIFPLPDGRGPSLFSPYSKSAAINGTLSTAPARP